jgi:hypothetical protein
LGIKYSTAKTLLRNYRQLYEQTDKTLLRNLLNDQKDQKNKEKPVVRCGYAPRTHEVASGSSPLSASLTEHSVFRPKIEIISTCLAGRSQ